VKFVRNKLLLLKGLLQFASCYISNLIGGCEYNCSSLFRVLARMATNLNCDFYDSFKAVNGVSSVVSSNKIYPFWYLMIPVA